MQHRSRFPSRRHLAVHGWTLLELLSVMLILSLMTGMAVTSISAARGSRRRIMLNRITLLIQRAREQALMKREPCDILIDLERNRITAQEGGAVLFEAALPREMRLTEASTEKESIRSGTILTTISPWGYAAGWRMRVEWNDGKEEIWRFSPPFGKPSLTMPGKTDAAGR